MNAHRFEDDALPSGVGRSDAQIHSLNIRAAASSEPAAEPGLVVRFAPGDPARIDATLAELRVIRSIRLKWIIDSEDWADPAFRGWFIETLPRVSAVAEPLVCLRPSGSRDQGAPESWHTDAVKKALLDPLRSILDSCAPNIGSIELEINPLDPADWDWRWDPDARAFGALIDDAARLAANAGLPFALGGLSAWDPAWLRALAARGALDRITALGLNVNLRNTHNAAQPSSSPARDAIAALREVNPKAQIWITSTPDWLAEDHDGEPLATLLDWLGSGVTRLYLGSTSKGAPRSALIRPDGSPSILTREITRAGVDGFREFMLALPAARPAPAPPPPAQRTIRQNVNGSSKLDGVQERERLALVTGGAGFIGANVADRLLTEGCRVRILDNLSRPGVENNLRRLIAHHGDRVEVILADIRQPEEVARAIDGVDQVYHFAAQVAVTTSVTHPTADFGVNVRGALNLLEAIRRSPLRPGLLFTSTNKVYGQLEDVELDEGPTRYQPRDSDLRQRGVNESRPLDFHSPYGCSKGAADQYVLDYARTYAVRACVFRMSCIYGALQHGTEDQGWVAHFLLKAMRGEPITIYGDGKQVRDILYVSDLVHAMLLAQRRIDALAGRVFNIGGGPANTISLLELMALIRESLGVVPKLNFGPWRTGDQKYYVSDTSAFREATGWSPRDDVRSGFEKLRQWLCERLPECAAPAPETIGQGKSVHAISQ